MALPHHTFASHSLAALLEATATPEQFLDDGSYANVYAFPEQVEGMEGYVLRVEKSVDLKRALQRSTSLTPVRDLVSNIHIGQPLMMLDGEHRVTILKKQTGTSFRKAFDDLRNEEGNGIQGQEAMLALMEEIVALAKTRKQNPFLPAFEKIHELAYSDYKPDINSQNLFIDRKKGTVELIDQLHQKRTRPRWNSHEYYANHELLEAAKEVLSLFEHNTDTNYIYSLGHLSRAHAPRPVEGPHPHHAKAFNQRYLAARGELETLVNSAVKTVQQEHAHVPHTLAFADVSEVRAAGLFDAPTLLVNQLKQLETVAQIRQR